MVVRGRRPGDQRTREMVLTTARGLFVEQGFNKTAMTSVARAAGVDTSLLYHYFGTKVNLFIECLLASPFPDGLDDLARARRLYDGREIVSSFLALWERDQEEPGRAFVALAQAASESPDAARAVQEYVTRRIWGAAQVRESGGDAAVPITSETARRFSMIGSQLVGIAWARYILKLEPLASTPMDEVAVWFGPTIDNYRNAGRGDAPGGSVTPTQRR
jgi:AcrR family transcriptional regulator